MRKEYPDISRRDFLNGAALTLAGATAAGQAFATLPSATPTRPINTDEYPPRLNGIRGNHDGAFEVAHQLAWQGKTPDNPLDLKEEYDLIVVGAGVSGLAAAYFYRQQYGNDARILLLDNHDDFGGHAKRNEFHYQGRKLLAPGGSMTLSAPGDYSDTVKGLLNSLGIDLDILRAGMDPNYRFSDLNSEMGMFFNQSHYDNNTIVNGRWFGDPHRGGEVMANLLAQCPLTDDELSSLTPFLNGEKDYLSDLSLSEKYQYLRSTSYQRFLEERVGLSRRVIEIFSAANRALVGNGPNSVAALDGIVYGPGLKSVGWLGKLASKLVPYGLSHFDTVYFPDGNAGVARALIHSLIPAVAPDSQDPLQLTDAHLDYRQLDHPEHLIRARLNSSVYRVDNHKLGVDVHYSQHGKAFTVSGKHCILACYNGIIPHLCPQLPESQKQNLKYGVKTPLVYTNVLINNHQAIRQSGTNLFLCPNNPYVVVTTTPPVSVGDYTPPNQNDDAVILQMQQASAPDGDGTQSARELYRQGRYQLYTKTFDAYETEIRQQLQQMFGQFGFDAERNIQAITVNRWSHGYSYEYNSLFDPEFAEGEEPHVLGRQPYGRISIANADSHASAYLDAAIDAAWRAVNEQLSI